MEQHEEWPQLCAIAQQRAELCTSRLTGELARCTARCAAHAAHLDDDVGDVHFLPRAGSQMTNSMGLTSWAMQTSCALPTFTRMVICLMHVHVLHNSQGQRAAHLDDNVGDVQLSAQGRQPDDQLDEVHIVGGADQLRLAEPPLGC